MDSACYDYLNGTLNWEGGQSKWTCQIANAFSFPVVIDYAHNLNEPARSITDLPALLGAGSRATMSNSGKDGDPPSGYYKAVTAATGALVAVFALSEKSADVVLDPSILNVPNDIGPIPGPTSSVPEAPIEPKPAHERIGSTVIVPQNGTSVLVGSGKAENGAIILREQFWALQNDSICLAGNETRTVSYSVTSGMQTVSSTETQVAMSLGVSASGGWGPVRASMNATLNRNTRVSQQISINEQRTSYVANSIHNPSVDPIAYLRWQLTDVITVLDEEGETPTSLVAQALNPTIVMGPYWVSPRTAPSSKGGDTLAPATLGLFEYK